ncbi:MAG: 8-amino-7-oxononanoate synthase [Gemmataceae bacterium]
MPDPTLGLEPAAPTTPHWLDDDIAAWNAAGLKRRRRRIESPSGAHLRHQGRELVNFASNDYLNLAGDPRLARAAAHAARKYGTGAGASALLAGYLPPLQRLERALARWQGTEAALVTSSGFAANLGTLTALAGPDDALFSDALNHASLIDGCRLSRAETFVYRHADLGHLDGLLRRAAGARRRLIITDSVFSMDGDLAPLDGLVELARRHDAVLIVDEAHATGVFGEAGRGLASACPKQEGDRLIKIGTLSKALGAQGGFVCASRKVIDWLINRARPYVFSTALAPPAAAAAHRALQIVIAEPEHRQRVLELADLLRRRLQQAGFPVTSSSCQIVPVLVGEPRRAVRLSKRLEAAGLLVPAIRPPTVPKGTSRLRISLSAGHTADDIDRLVQALVAEE